MQILAGQLISKFAGGLLCCLSEDGSVKEFVGELRVESTRIQFAVTVAIGQWLISATTAKAGVALKPYGVHSVRHPTKLAQPLTVLCPLNSLQP